MKGWLTFSFLFSLVFSFAQTPVFHGDLIKEKTNNSYLDQHFFDYQVFEFNSNALYQAVKADDNDLAFQLELGDEHSWSMYLYPSNLRSSDYLVRSVSETGLEKHTPNLEVKAFQGDLIGSVNGSVRLTMDNGFLYGTIQEGDVTYLIEPLSYFEPGAGKDEFVLYEASNVIPYEGNACGVTEMAEQKEHIHNHKESQDAEKNGLCYEVDLAIASDGLMFQKYGSIAAVENHNIAVMNNVAGNWDDEFNDEIVFVIVEQFVSQSPAADPWTNSTNAGTLLNSFANWGPGGFSTTHDLGSLWTDRDFNGGTIGIAYLSVVCTSNRYHCLQDFTSNAQFLRVLTSHEIGHNFSVNHDPSGTWIMSPTVNGSTQWSPNSTNVINGYYPNRPCLSFCAPPAPPVPVFSSNINSLCSGSMVTFYDESLFGPTSWSWSFPGATPSSSTEQNPTVTYSNPGAYNVTLTVSNANGNTSLTQPGFIIVSPSGGTDFFFRSDFEDGLQGWTVENPDGGETWVNAQVGGAIEGVRAMKMDNYNYNAPGQRDGLISPTMDLSGRTTATLEIDYAYRRYSPAFSDSMIVYVSIDGGATFPNRIFADAENGSGNFATAGQSTDDFTPDELSDWCFGGTIGNDCLELDLTPFVGEPNVKVKIENYNDYSNNLFIEVVRGLSDCQIVNPPVAAFSGQPTSGCAPLTVNLTDESTGDPTSWIWTMPGAIPPSSTMQNPVIGYTQPGVYDITLTAINSAGANSVTELQYIVVEGPPQADFSSAVNGADVDFTNTTTGGGNSFLWSFGDGETSTLENPSYTYSEDGTYSVSLTVIGNCGSSTVQYPVTIQTPPLAAFSSSVTSGCVPLGVQFLDESSNNTASWSWQFPGGDPATSTDQNPFVSYDTPGTYDVILTVSNASGNSSVTEVAYITVEPLPVADFSASVNGYQVNFTNNSSNANSYSWDFGDGMGTSSAMDPSYTYSADGDYTVILEVSNDCGTDIHEFLVSISNLPVPGFSTDVNSGCAPLTVQFTDESSSNATSWSWSFPGGTPSTSTAQNPSVVYNNVGVYDVSLTVSNAAGSNTITLIGVVTVDDVPNVGFTSSVSDLTIDFTNTSSNANSYSWDFGDGVGTSTATDPSYTYSVDGTYTVTLTATNDCGSTEFVENITVSTSPIPDFSSDVTSGCVPLTVQFIDESSSNATSWSWSFPGGNPSSSTEQNPEVVYNAAGVYDVSLTVSNASGSNTITLLDYIVVDDVPAVGFTSSVTDLTVDFTNTSSNADSYSWDFGDGVGTSTASDPSYTYSVDGTYTVTLTASNDCGSTEFVENITVSTSPIPDFSSDVTSGCAPLTVQFTDESSSNATSWSWSFPGGNPSSSTDQNPVVVYNTAGVYDVNLTVSNSAGSNTINLPNYISVNDVPTVGFDESVNGTTVDFTNNSSGATSFDWDFGDGMGTSQATDPSYTYQEDGTYTVTLNATNACGTVMTTETVVIVTPPSAAFVFDPPNGCAPLTVQFNDASSANATSWSWSFPGGNPSTSTAQNPVVEYTTAGTYSVTLEVGNAAGMDMVSQTDIIVVNDVPVVGFDESVNGTTVDFTNNSSGATSFDWDFGDGMGTSQAADPSYTYQADGTYTVTLSATNDCGTVMTTETVVITTPPTAGFSVDQTDGCVPFTVTFINTSSANATSFEWNFPGGNPSSSTMANPVVVYEAPGVYDVSMTAFNTAGQSTAIEFDYIVVSDVPEADFGFTINDSTVDFDNLSSGANTYSWDFGDGMGTSQLADPSYTYSEDGVYNVVLTATNDCGTVTLEQNIVIATAGPVALFSSSTSEGCAPLEVQFTNESSANTESIEWSFPGGNPSTSDEQNPVVVYDTPGEYTVSLTASNPNGADTYIVTDYVIVIPEPTADFSPTLMGPTVDFTNLSINANSYQWFFGDGEESQEVNPTYTYDQIGTYQVELIATNDCGTDVITIEVEIEALIPQALFVADPASGCAPLTVQFTDESSGGPTSWEWTFEGGTPATSDEQNPLVTFETPGVYDVSLTASNLAGENMLVQSQFITVIGEPDAEFGFTVDGYEVVFDNTSNGGTSFSWDFGDDSGSNNPSPSHVYDEDGIYLVVLSVTNECGTSTFEQEIVINVTSVEEITAVDRFELFPNPNDGRFTVLLEGSAGQFDELQIELFNVIGQQLYDLEADFQMGYLKHQMDIQDLAKGVYFLRVRLGDQYLVKQLIVQ